MFDRGDVKRSMACCATYSVASAPVAAGVVALLWQFPLVITGTSGHSVGAAISAMVSMALFMTLFSFFAGGLAVAAIGAAVGLAFRDGSENTHLCAGMLIGSVSALAVALCDAAIAN